MSYSTTFGLGNQAPAWLQASDIDASVSKKNPTDHDVMTIALALIHERWTENATQARCLKFYHSPEATLRRAYNPCGIYAQVASKYPKV